MPTGACILTVNGGSSSIKFALYQMRAQPQKGLHGKIERIGLLGNQLVTVTPVALHLTRVCLTLCGDRTIGWASSAL